ncbi:PREDICTED: structural maintenance of chromosomes protein 6 [Vollenhovia emeryi]|uniref:structural maintenance of chromosomes protein 6 n=1 Tax=Vollenhovia emeryi TaxID=411798 RepID=UPI0005F3D654|nr:PREDICTED: structural maintenance of chromosomes protein 6 [Vollenhovia emeryi]
MESNAGTRRRRGATEADECQAKRAKCTEDSEEDVDDEVQDEEHTAGKVKKVRVHNFMCHDALEVTLNKNVNFIVGRNGSGKSAILTALTVGLGARANVTSRGTSIKEFIKKGRNSATVEIVLVNKGESTYKPEIYGDTITVVRNIGISTSNYKIKNWKGDVISTKRDELDNIISTMNIQIDNPISVLNQDVSRTFLVTSKPDEKYSLFMKATLLDAIEINYKEALSICEEEYTKLKQYSAALAQVKGEIHKLKDSIHRLEEMDESRAELSHLEMEYEWAMAIMEENKLRNIQETLKLYESKLKQLEDVELSIGTKDEEIDRQIEEIKQKIQQAEEEVKDSSGAYNSAKKNHSDANEEFGEKQREWRSVISKIKRMEDDVSLLKKEIQKLESCDNEHNKRKEMIEQLSKLEERLDEHDASLRTRQTELMHLEADKMRHTQDVQFTKIEMENCGRHISKLKRDLSAVEQQSDNALSVFGPNIPRLLKRIEEEYRKRRFKEKPRGPIGAFIKMKDAAWAPAVENFLGGSFLSSFCVDNSQDSKLLNSIMKEIFYNENTLQIICSKFFNKVHDVRSHCIQSSQYSNLLEAMVIEDPVVANCLIDQREIECILLIPTSNEACEIMSNMTKVPRNCKRAFTLNGDTFYPDPNYRTYGGRGGMRAKFLQVSTMEAMQTLKEELQTAENKKQEVTMAFNAVCERERVTNSELTRVAATVRKLRSAQSECTNLINELKDKIESNEATSANVFRNEIAELEKKLALESATEKLLAENVQKLQKNVESLNTEVRRCRDLRHNSHMVIDPLKDQIKELAQEKDMHRQDCQRATRKLREIRQDVQRATGEFEKQERATVKAVTDATEKCPRINTARSTNQIKILLTDLRDKIREIENQFGCVDELRRQLKEKEQKYGVNIEFTAQLKQSFEKHIARVKQRQKMFLQLRDMYSTCIQKSFTDMLSLRQYTGKVVIDHVNKVLDLHVSARNDKKAGNDTRSLSGGERSYSTMAFILALWDCIQLPFYFLDEFDVFMDKVNRRVIMDILLDHTRSHPQSQFAFLTPLDTSHILAEDYVTIHQLQPPERKNLSQ